METSVPSSMIPIRKEKEDRELIRKVLIGPAEENILLPAVDEADRQARGKDEEKERTVPEALQGRASPPEEKD